MAAALPLLWLPGAGCASRTDAPTQQAPLPGCVIPEAFSGAPTNAALWVPATPAAHVPRGAWWAVFGDPELDRLENLAATNNHQLAVAMARFSEARAAVSITRADLFPQASLDPAAARQRSSYNAPANGHADGAKPTYNTFTLSLQAGWEADLWGRVQHQVEAANARLAASAADLESVRLAVQAELATDYFSLRERDATLDLLQRTAATDRQALELTRNRRSGGIATDLDVAQAETQLRTIEALLPALRLERTRLVHAVAALSGQLATGFEVRGPESAMPVAPQIPASLPSQMLERRPDVAAAEQRMTAANAAVGVARTAFYPRFRLNGLAGFQSVSAATWLNGVSQFWSIGPSLDLPIFTGDRTQAQLDLARASYDESQAVYRQAVVDAVQEVEDQLAAQQLLAEQVVAQTSALTSSRRTLELATNRYKAGLVTYLDVAAAQSAAFTIERAVVQLRGQQMLAAVGLVRALGGGWVEAAAVSPD